MNNFLKYVNELISIIRVEGEYDNLHSINVNSNKRSVYLYDSNGDLLDILSFHDVNKMNSNTNFVMMDEYLGNI